MSRDGKRLANTCVPCSEALTILPAFNPYNPLDYAVTSAPFLASVSMPWLYLVSLERACNGNGN